MEISTQNAPVKEPTEVKITESNQNDQNDSTVEPPKGYFGTRHVFGLMAFIGMVIAYMLRVNLSVAIVVMVNRTRTSEPDSYSSYSSVIQGASNSSSVCPSSGDQPTEDHEGEFNWDSTTQGLVLGVFSWGYMASQIPAGLLAERFGGKHVFGLGVLFAGLCNVLTPVAARDSVAAMLALRVLTGIGEGVTFPAMHAMLARWVPKPERSTIGAFVYAGTQFGTVISYPLSGYLCTIPVDNGWPFAFYVPGALAAIWYVLWWFLTYNGPDVHPRISEEEKRYIMSTTERVETEKQSLSSIPWLSIITSVPFWAILIAHIGQDWGFYVLLSELPTYMKTVLQFDLQSNSLLSAVPYLAMWFMTNVFSITADTLRKKKIINLTQARKICNTIGYMGPACLLIGASYTGCDRNATFALIAVSTGLNGGVYSGFLVNHVDVASNYAGILMAITNTIGNVCGFLAPYIIGVIVTTEGSLSQWQIVFFITAGIYTFTNLVFVIFGTGKEQSWNHRESQKPVEDFVDESNTNSQP